MRLTPRAPPAFAPGAGGLLGASSGGGGGGGGGAGGGACGAAAARRRVAEVRLPPPLLRISLPLFVKDFRLVGAKRLPYGVVRDAVSGLLGRRASRSGILAALRRVDDWFARRGYVASRVAVAGFPTRDNGHTLVVASVEAVLVSVRLEAVDADEVFDPGVAVRTREDTVARALGIRVGSVFRWGPNAFDRLMALGVFDFARAELEVLGPVEVGVLVSVREKRTGRVEPGLGINSDGQSYGDVSLEDANFLGRAQRLRVEWQRRLGMERSAGGIQFEDPRIGARVPFAVRARLFRDVNDGRALPGGAGRDGLRADGDRDRDGAMTEVLWSPVRFPRLGLSCGPVLERVRLPALYAGEAASQNQAMWVFSSTLDLAESVPLPRSGRRVSCEYGLGTGIGTRGRPDRRRTQNEIFQKFNLRAAQYLPMGSKGSVAMGATLGTGTSNLPWHEQKPLGGPGTVRGYVYGELGRAPTFATARVELRLPLVTPAPYGGSGEEGKADGQGENGGPAEKKPKPVQGQWPFRNRATTRDTGDIVVTKDGIQGADADDQLGKTNPNGFPKLPSMVGIVFADAATTEVFGRHMLGGSQGIGVRVGGILSVELARTLNGRGPRLHFGVVDRNL